MGEQKRERERERTIERENKGEQAGGGQHRRKGKAGGRRTDVRD